MQMSYNIQFHLGIPSEEDIESFTTGSSHKVMVIDDLQNSASKSKLVEKLFLCISHHKNLSVFYVVQNFFNQGPCVRNISLNAHYIILFRNARDKLQITTLGKQLGITQLLLAAYNDATSIKYNPLIIDLSPHGEEKYKLRSQVFPQDKYTVVYQ